jgi:hypothetical protein
MFLFKVRYINVFITIHSFSERSTLQEPKRLIGSYFLIGGRRTFKELTSLTENSALI